MMLDIIKNLLLKIIDDIDQGNSNMTAEECHEKIDTLNRVTNKNEKFSKYQACNYLGISTATFDNYVSEGKIPKGLKQPGFKELFWLKRDLDEIKEKLQKK